MAFEDVDFPTDVTAAFEAAASEQSGSVLKPYIYT